MAVSSKKKSSLLPLLVALPFIPPNPALIYVNKSLGWRAEVVQISPEGYWITKGWNEAIKYPTARDATAVLRDYGFVRIGRKGTNPAIPLLDNPPSLYQAFHGASPKRVKKVHLPDIKRAVKIGRLKSLVYAPEAPSKRKGQHFEHSFGDYGYKFERGQEPILAVSADGKQLILIGGKYFFGERGIVG